MSSTEQNGRLVSAEQALQAAPPTDPRTRNVPPPPPVPDSKRICRDFVWGICVMHTNCKYRHELEFESMKSILKFCHDFQNRTGCARPDCTYLHTSREEENAFLANGQIPRVLAERYASIGMPLGQALEPAPNMAYDYMPQPQSQPQQPPPPPLPSTSGLPQPPLPGSITAQMSGGHNMSDSSSNISGGLPSHNSSQISVQMPDNISDAVTNHMPVHISAPMHGGITSQMPGSMSSQMPGPMSSQMSGPMSSQMPGPMSSQMPGPMSSQMPGHMSSQMPGPMSSQMPGPMSSQMPGPMSSQMPGPMSSQMPGPMSSQMPGPMSSQMPGPMSSQMAGSMSSQMPGPGPIHPSMPSSMSQMTVCGMMPGPMIMEQTVTQAAMPMSMQAAIPSLGQPPLPTLPPPPPPPPPTISPTPARMTGPVYTVATTTPQNLPLIYPCPQLQQPQHAISYPVVFDPSRPPPPISIGPSNSTPQGRAQKRSASDSLDAGTSKVRKIDGSNDSSCETCVQRELRCELYQQQIEKLQREEDINRLLQKKKSEEFDQAQLLLQSLISSTPDRFRAIHEYLDSNNTTTPSILNDLFESPQPTHNSGHSTVPRQFLLQLMEYVLNTPKSPPEHHIPALETLTRRTNPQADVIASIMELIRSSEGVAGSSRASSSVESINTNGMNRFANGLLEMSSPGGAAAAMARYSNVLPAPPPTSAPRYPPPSVQQPRAFPSTGEPVGLPPPAPPVAPAPPAPHPYMNMNYSPGIPPPPSIPFYPAYPGPANNVPYNNPVSPQNTRPSTSVAPPAAVNGQAYAQYLARMPHQYYPPFQ